VSTNEDISIRIRLLRVQQFVRDARLEAQAVDNIGKKAKGADRSFRGLAGSTNKLTHGFGLLHRMSYLLSVGLTGVVGMVGYSALNFEQQMAKVAAINETTLTGVSGLSEAAIQFGQDTRFSATDAAQGMYELSAAGVKTNDITKVLSGTLDLAAATGYDLAASAEVQTQVLNSFGLGAEQSTKVADILTAAVNTSALKMDDLGTSFKYVGAVSQLLNFSLEDVTTALALMAKGGQTGSQAGTALNTGFLRLLKPSNQVVEALDRLGISLDEVQGKPLPDILDKFRDAQERVTDTVYAGATATIFGLNAIDGLGVLLNSTRGEWDDFSAAMHNSEGVAKRNAETMNNTTLGALERLKGAFEALFIDDLMGNSPEIQRQLNAVSEFLTRLGDEGSSALGDFEPYWTTFSQVAEDIWVIMRDGVWPAFMNVKEIVEDMLAPFGGLTGITGVLADNAGSLTPIITGLIALLVVYRTTAMAAAVANAVLGMSFLTAGTAAGAAGAGAGARGSLMRTLLNPRGLVGKMNLALLAGIVGKEVSDRAGTSDEIHDVYMSTLGGFGEWAARGIGSITNAGSHPGQELPGGIRGGLRGPSDAQQVRSVVDPIELTADDLGFLEHKRLTPLEIKVILDGREIAAAVATRQVDMRARY
jgi:TP901 family phage tail tape measure protein